MDYTERINKEGPIASVQGLVTATVAENPSLYYICVIDRWLANRETCRSGNCEHCSGISKDVPYFLIAGGVTVPYKYFRVQRDLYLPGRGLSMIRKVDGLEESVPLHFGSGDSSIFLREACTS